MNVGGMVVRFSIFSMSLLWLTTSKARLMSTAIVIVRCGGRCLLKPEAMTCVINWRAVVVLCFFLYPCWYFFLGRWSLILLSTILSNSLAMLDSNDIGRYDFPSSLSFPGLSSGAILAVFQTCGMMFLV